MWRVTGKEREIGLEGGKEGFVIPKEVLDRERCGKWVEAHVGRDKCMVEGDKDGRGEVMMHETFVLPM